MQCITYTNSQTEPDCRACTAKTSQAECCKTTSDGALGHSAIAQRHPCTQNTYTDKHTHADTQCTTDIISNCELFPTKLCHHGQLTCFTTQTTHIQQCSHSIVGMPNDLELYLKTGMKRIHSFVTQCKSIYTTKSNLTVRSWLNQKPQNTSLTSTARVNQQQNSKYSKVKSIQQKVPKINTMHLRSWPNKCIIKNKFN